MPCGFHVPWLQTLVFDWEAWYSLLLGLCPRLDAPWRLEKWHSWFSRMPWLFPTSDLPPVASCSALWCHRFFAPTLKQEGRKRGEVPKGCVGATGICTSTAGSGSGATGCANTAGDFLLMRFNGRVLDSTMAPLRELYTHPCLCAWTRHLSKPTASSSMRKWA